MPYSRFPGFSGKPGIRKPYFSGINVAQRQTSINESRSDLAGALAIDKDDRSAEVLSHDGVGNLMQTWQ